MNINFKMNDNDTVFSSILKQNRNLFKRNYYLRIKKNSNIKEKELIKFRKEKKVCFFDSYNSLRYLKKLYKRIASIIKFDKEFSRKKLFSEITSSKNIVKKNNDEIHYKTRSKKSINKCIYVNSKEEANNKVIKNKIFAYYEEIQNCILTKMDITVIKDYLKKNHRRLSLLLHKAELYDKHIHEEYYDFPMKSSNQISKDDNLKSIIKKSNEENISILAKEKNKNKDYYKITNFESILKINNSFNLDRIDGLKRIPSIIKQ